jgi:hypothetical protein
MMKLAPRYSLSVGALPKLCKHGFVDLLTQADLELTDRIDTDAKLFDSKPILRNNSGIQNLPNFP